MKIDKMYVETNIKSYHSEEKSHHESEYNKLSGGKSGKIECYKGNNGFYRIDHFGDVYVIESAENEDEAKLNIFEDDDLFSDSTPRNVLISNVRSALKDYDS